MNSDSEFYENKEYEVERITIHPQYHPGQLRKIDEMFNGIHLMFPGNLFNDLAIIKLQDQIEIEKFDHIGTICLPHHAQVC